MVAVALGVTWLLDGLEGSLGGSLAGALSQSREQGGLAFSDADLGLASSLYLAGAVAGAVCFGYLADRFGRRALFFWTLAVYVVATSLTGLSWNLVSFAMFRVITGAGIGGEYAAINSAVDELMPARLRGRIDLWINGTFWIGILLGSVVSIRLVAMPLPGHIPGWRIAFCSGIPIAILVLFLRRSIPESPRWLMARGREAEAMRVMDTIEIAVSGHRSADVDRTARPRIAPLVPLSILFSAQYLKRTIVCVTLMVAQAFFYNSVFFSLSLVLLRFYRASNVQISHCFTQIAIANVIGPMVLGPLFDTVGRRRMIAITYGLAGVTLMTTAVLFVRQALSAEALILCWAIGFFFASTAASSAYLTVSEVFPQPIRATAIAIFYSFGTLVGGVSAPLIFGRLIGSGTRHAVFDGYLAGALLMVCAGVVAFMWGIDAEGKSLEELTSLHECPFEDAAA